MSQGSWTPKPVRGTTVIRCIIEWSLVEEKRNPKRGDKGHPREAALGGPHIHVGLESTPKRSSKLLLRTQLLLPHLSTSGYFFISLLLVPLGPVAE